VAIGLVYMIMVILFRLLLVCFVIMCTLPLAVSHDWAITLQRARQCQRKKRRHKRWVPSLRMARSVANTTLTQLTTSSMGKTISLCC
jgi:hypothetical protein